MREIQCSALLVVSVWNCFKPVYYLILVSPLIMVSPLFMDVILINDYVQTCITLRNQERDEDFNPGIVIE